MERSSYLQGHFSILIQDGYIKNQPSQQVLKHGWAQMPEGKINKLDFSSRFIPYSYR